MMVTEAKHRILSSTLLYLDGFFLTHLGLLPLFESDICKLESGNVLGKIISLTSKNVIEQEANIAYLGALYSVKPIV